jgi:hypothetical protein
LGRLCPAVSRFLAAPFWALFNLSCFAMFSFAAFAALQLRPNNIREALMFLTAANFS